jgi:hypothetical protein
LARVSAYGPRTVNHHWSSAGCQAASRSGSSITSSKSAEAMSLLARYLGTSQRCREIDGRRSGALTLRPRLCLPQPRGRRGTVKSMLAGRMAMAKNLLWRKEGGGAAKLRSASATAPQAPSAPPSPALSACRHRVVRVRKWKCDACNAMSVYRL